TTSTQVQQAEAGVVSAQKAVDTARAQLESANASLSERQANYVKAQKDLVRFKDLVEKDEISKQDYDAAVAAAEANRAMAESAKGAVSAARHSVDQAVAQLDEAKARLATAVVQRRQSEGVRARQQAVSVARYKQSQATVQQRQADLEQANLNLQYTIVRAPVDGVVSRKNAEPGMQVSPGQQIMAIVPLDDIWVTANFKETQLKQMRAGQRVEIEVDTYGSSRKYRGHVDSIAAASGAKFSLLPPENATGNYVKVVQRVPVKIVLEPGENRDHLLLPGMSVTPTVLLNSGTNNAY
ncbi:MAG: HlyD family secretion protein, partial [Acidobacteria bacterium]|nr:HlyD family secretion protein [Acidobacteriota bacterium]